MKKFYRILSLILVIALAVGMFAVPVSAAEDEERFAVYEASVKTTIRAEPYQDSKALLQIDRGALVLCTETVKNAYGNNWIQTVDPASGQTGYVYSGKLRAHTCKFRAVDGCDTLMYCRCGTFAQREHKGAKPMNAAAAVMPQPTITPDVVAALGTLGLAAKGVAATVLPYIPYVGMAVVCGVVIYAAVSVAQDVSIEKVSTDWKKLDKDYRPEDGVYYNGMIKNGVFFINRSDPMDMNEAMRQINRDISTHCFSVDTVLWFVYTVQPHDAEALVKNYLKLHPGFSADYSGVCHGDKTSLRQFKHYHITSMLNHNLGARDEHYGGHVCFGTPACDSLWGQGAWF